MKVVNVNDLMQHQYSYTLVEEEGKNFHPDFRPELTPAEMLELGVFGGKYLTDCRSEYPNHWFTKAKLSPEKKDVSLNYYSVDASQSLREWQAKGWIDPQDPRGWFQWYCRYFMGRRTPTEDARQIKRWKAFSVMLGRSKNIATQVTGVAGKNSDRQFYTGPIIPRCYKPANVSGIEGWDESLLRALRSRSCATPRVIAYGRSRKPR